MHLTITTEDRQIYLETPNAVHYPTNWPTRRAHIINDDSFWNSVDKDIWAIQYHTDGDKHIEYKTSSGKGNVTITDTSILQKFIDKFNLTEQLFQVQTAWDKDTLVITNELGHVRSENVQEKTTRLGPRPQ